MEDIKRRCYRFSVSMIKFLKGYRQDGMNIVILRQLMRSAMSVGANVIEAKNSSSRVEFKRYYEIALKSANESKYWMCLLRDGFNESSIELKKILLEADEIAKILAASILKLKGKK